MDKDTSKLRLWVEETIRNYVRSPENTLRNEGNEPAWTDPLIGYSRGDDPLYPQLKSMIGEFFWEPFEIFKLTFPDINVAPRDLTVISWVLPQTEATKADNRKEAEYGSERWVRARKFGEEFNVKLRNHVAEVLTQAGYQAVAPANSPLFRMQMSDAYWLSSNWSERHAAYVSGLGTFGLCEGLITAAGKAIRVGSVVARISIAPTKRPYVGHHDYCLFYSQGTCGECIKRCPVEAVSKQGHDKRKCRAYVETAIADHAWEAYGIEAYGCGLCQTKVPCESRIPEKRR